MRTIDARKYANAVKQGFERMKFYRRSRAMFIKAYVGQYYAKKFGLIGDEPVNLIFHTIRSMVPNLVMKSPINKVDTETLEYSDYAFLLSKALNWLDDTINFKDILRYGIVDAMFGLAVFKTGLAKSGSLINFGDIVLDNGQVYTDNVSLDDYVFDPSCKILKNAIFEGDRNRIPRQILLDDDDFDHDLVMELPSSRHPDAAKKIEALTQSNLSSQEIYELQDYVDVVETFIPEANAIAVIADPEQIILNDYLSLREYYGPKEGCYTKLTLTQPVPDNPFPIAPVSIWYDMHHIANKVMKKVMLKADRQKDVAVYDPGAADEAEDIRTSDDGDMVAGNPDTVKVVSFGGSKSDDHAVMTSLKEWFNYISGNPDQMAGVTPGAKTATGQSILQGNMSIGLDDLNSMVYDCGKELNKKMAWFLHTDPLIDLPFSHRKPGGEKIQLKLTPEERSGDFLDFNFTIKQRSMSRLDPAIRAKRIEEFGTKVVPSICTSAQICMQMGVPFNVTKSLSDMADEMGILEEVHDWLVDPTFIQRMQLMMVMGPQPTGKAQTSIQSNGQPTNVANVPSMQKEFNQQTQAGANASQSNIQGAY